MDLERELERYRGCVTGLARRMGISRQAAAARVVRAGLDERAAQLRAAYGVSGTRASLRSGSLDPDGERRAIRAALRACGSQLAAAAALGIHRRSLQRAMERLGIT